MNNSEIALRVLAAVDISCTIPESVGLSKKLTRAEFATRFPTADSFECFFSNNEQIDKRANELAAELSYKNIDGIICSFDEEFPQINPRVKNKSEKPFLLFYKGDISLLKRRNDNVTVIGSYNISDDIETRERRIVKALIDMGAVVVSGLANGCDSVSHRVCVENGAKTVAILPSPVDSILPAENRELAEAIVGGGGLLVTEYYKNAASAYELMSRYKDRDILQAEFSKAIILIASHKYVKKVGSGDMADVNSVGGKKADDSGSRHAMDAAKRFGVPRYTMYSPDIDSDNPTFSMNRELLQTDPQVKILCPRAIEELAQIRLFPEDNTISTMYQQQLSFDDFL